MKPIKFDLPMNSTRISALEQLEENLTPEILEHFRSGKLAKWLRVRTLNEQADKVEALTLANVQDEVQLFKSVCEVFVSEVDENDAREALEEYKNALASQNIVEEEEEKVVEVEVEEEEESVEFDEQTTPVKDIEAVTPWSDALTSFFEKKTETKEDDEYARFLQNENVYARLELLDSSSLDERAKARIMASFNKDDLSTLKYDLENAIEEEKEAEARSDKASKKYRDYLQGSALSQMFSSKENLDEESDRLYELHSKALKKRNKVKRNVKKVKGILKANLINKLDT